LTSGFLDKPGSSGGFFVKRKEVINMKEICQRNKIGYCQGCQVQSLAAEKMIKVVPEQRKTIFERIGRGLCPTGEIMQEPNIPNRKIW